MIEASQIKCSCADLGPWPTTSLDICCDSSSAAAAVALQHMDMYSCVLVTSEAVVNHNIKISHQSR